MTAKGVTVCHKVRAPTFLPCYATEYQRKKLTL